MKRSIFVIGKDPGGFAGLPWAVGKGTQCLPGSQPTPALQQAGRADAYQQSA